MRSMFLMMAVAVAAPLTMLSTPETASAANNAALTINAPGSVRPSQHISVAGQLRVNGAPCANVPVVLFFRKAGGPDVVVANGVTNANGNYRLVGTIPANPGATVQVSVVSGGALQNVARAAVIVPVR